MNDKMKFHEMTKPIRFRRLKMMKQYAVLWCKALRERIKYLFNYILYKLHILKRYSYRDNSERESFAFVPLDFKPEVVETDYIKGIVMPRLMIRYNVDIDYFYYERNGETKITLQLKDKNESKAFLNTFLTDLHLKVTGIWFDVSKLPRFKVAILPPPNAFDTTPAEEEKPVEYNTVTYDVRELKNLCHRSILSDDFISSEEFYYHYTNAVKKFKERLSIITLKDLEV